MTRAGEKLARAHLHDKENDAVYRAIREDADALLRLAACAKIRSETPRAVRMPVGFTPEEIRFFKEHYRFDWETLSGKTKTACMLNALTADGAEHIKNLKSKSPAEITVRAFFPTLFQQI